MASGAAPWVQNAVGGSPVGQTLTLEKVADERVLGRGGFALTSAAFRHDGELDPSFTAVEEDAVAPPLEWTAPPPGAQELVLVVEDADRGHVHWTVWGLAAQKGKLMEGETPPRTGVAHPTICPYETFQCADGPFFIGRFTHFISCVLSAFFQFTHGAFVLAGHFFSAFLNGITGIVHHLTGVVGGFFEINDQVVERVLFHQLLHPIRELRHLPQAKNQRIG